MPASGQATATTSVERQPAKVSTLTRLERRRLLLASIAEGNNLRESSRLAGVSYKTALRWHRTEVENQKGLIEARVSVLQKHDALKTLDSIVNDPETDQRDRINAIALAGKFLGHEAPTRSLNVTITAPAGVLSWLDQLDTRILDGAQLTLDNPSPPKQIPPTSDKD